MLRVATLRFPLGVTVFVLNFRKSVNAMETLKELLQFCWSKGIFWIPVIVLSMLLTFLTCVPE